MSTYPAPYRRNKFDVQDYPSSFSSSGSTSTSNPNQSFGTISVLGDVLTTGVVGGLDQAHRSTLQATTATSTQLNTVDTSTSITSLLGTKFDKAGGTFTGAVDMGSNILTAANLSTTYATFSGANSHLYKLQASSTGSAGTYTLTLPSTIPTTKAGLQCQNGLCEWVNTSWADLIGNIDWRTGGGANAPTLTDYYGDTVYYLSRCGTGGAAKTDFFFNFHIPHDYTPGTDLYIHVHWSVNVTGGTGNANFIVDGTYGSINGAFNTTTVTAKNITAAVQGQYIHVVSEIQISAAGGTGGLLNTSNIETDGLLFVRVRIDNANVLHTLNTTARNALFLHQSDLHYLSTNSGTKNRSPPFTQ